MKFPKQVKKKLKKKYKNLPESLKKKFEEDREYDKKLKNMKLNLQIGRAMQKTMENDASNFREKILNNPKIIELIKEKDKIIASKPVWNEDEYNALCERFLKRMIKIVNTIITFEDIIEAAKGMMEKYTPEERKQLELYQEYEHYWSDF